LLEHAVKASIANMPQRLLIVFTFISLILILPTFTTFISLILVSPQRSTTLQ
jgi:hypothetical protein